MEFRKRYHFFRLTQPTLWVIAASIFFITVQWLYNYILWHTDGNIPPSAGDSFNYLFNIHKFAVGQRFLSIPNELATGAFNYFYGLISIIFHLQPDTIYYLGFFFSKVALLWALIYFFYSVSLPETTIAILLLILGAFSGTGEIHGFYWAVPSLWMVIVFLILLGMAFRKIAWWLIVPVAFFLVNVHPMANYLIVIVAGMYGLLSLLRTNTGHLLRLILVLLVVVLANQLYVIEISRARTLGASQLNNVAEVSKAFVSKVDPAGGEVRAPAESPSAQAPVSVILWTNVTQKIKNDSASSDYSTVYLQKQLIQWFPSLPVFWNAYLAFFFTIPYSYIVFVPLLILIIYLVFQRPNWPIISLFIVSFLVSLAALSHPQGYRAILFLWPATLMVLGLGVARGILQKKALAIMSIRIPARIIKAISIVFLVSLLVLWLGYSGFFLNRIARAASGHWDTTCVQEILAKSRPTEPIYYSGYDLSSSAMIAHGLYERQNIEYMQWGQYISSEQLPKVFILDRYLSRDPTTAIGQEKVRDTISQIEREYNLKRTERSCGAYTYWLLNK